jgi:hypothetical protein
MDKQALQALFPQGIESRGLFLVKTKIYWEIVARPDGDTWVLTPLGEELSGQAKAEAPAPAKVKTRAKARAKPKPKVAPAAEESGTEAPDADVDELFQMDTIEP